MTAKLLGLVLGFASVLALAQDSATFDVGAFSRNNPGGLPAGWEPLTFDNIPEHTRYEIVRNGDRVAVRAEANASASGLIRQVRIDPQEYPILRWHWKIENLIEGADLTRKDGDDYPARLYIAFRGDRDRLSAWERFKLSLYGLVSGREPPTAAINYVWDGKAPEGTIVPNAYTNYVRMVVVRSGTDRINEWITEERNVAEDYRAAFGEEALPIVGVAIMTDSDNTGASAVAWYGDITFRRGEN